MVALIGAGSHGRDIAVIWKRRHPKKSLVVYDDDPRLGIFPPSSLQGTVIYGINNPTQRFNASIQHAMRPAKPLVDPAARIGPNVEMGRGVVVGPGTVLLHDVILGNHVHIHYMASMTRCHIKSFTTVSPGATIAGDVSIGRRCLIGANVTICDRVKIGNDVKVGAGAIVLPTAVVPDGVTVTGVWKGLDGADGL